MDLESLYTAIKDTLRISSDTRSIQSGDIYIGIKGDVFDGNAFAAEALSKGARFALIDNEEFKTDERCIVVTDTRQTLKDLAKFHRSQFSIPIIAIGGSNGKTTTKELVHAVLDRKYKTHVTKGNLNNDLGVPFTILAMPLDTELAIIEIGANHATEHLDLLEIVKPTHVLVTNNGADHLEGFGSLEGVRAANKEIFDWAKSNNAHAFVNKIIQDLMEDSNETNRTLYPLKEWLSASTISAAVRYDGTLFASQLFGSYNEPNLLAAIATGEYFEVPTQKIQEAINTYEPTLKRSQIIKEDSHTLILDCYNANPSSMELALRDFAKTTFEKRIFIIGDMLEMGDAEPRVHKEILELVKELIKKEDIIICVGPRFAMYKNNFPFTFFETTADARPYFKNMDLNGATIFVKASRGIKLENVVL